MEKELTEDDMQKLFADANVSIRMKGLGVLHYNKKTLLWESLLLRGLANHDLTIFIREYDLSGKQISEQKEIIPQNVENIEILTSNIYSNDTEKPKESFRQDRDFNYDSTDDVKDSRWIIDLCEEVHRKEVNLKRKNYTDTTVPVKLTFVTISDATLYTANLHDRKYAILDASTQRLLNNNRIVNPRVMASWSGMDIVWKGADSSTILKIGDKTIPLNRKDTVSKYVIEINSNCTGDNCSPRGDFHYYYDYLIDEEAIFEETIPDIHNFIPSGLNIRSLQDLDNPEFLKLTKLVEFLTENSYGGKTNDCGFIIIPNPGNGLTSLKELLS